jgi:hypothetical protein
LLALEPDRQREAGDTRPLDPARAIATMAEAIGREANQALASEAIQR